VWSRHGPQHKPGERPGKRAIDKPVTTIINTNSHPSHSGNNFRFGGEGVLVISHEQTRSRLQSRDNFQGASARHLPQTTFRGRLTLMRGKERIDLYYFGASNTDGDAWVVFPSRRIMHIGDVVKKDEMVEITPSAGGRAVSYAETMARGMATIKDVDLVVAGHSHRAARRPHSRGRNLRRIRRTRACSSRPCGTR
jgi:cyclase